jgi:hypothetical protein
MQHELDHWKKARQAILKEVGGGQAFYEVQTLNPKPQPLTLNLKP